jgi:hypothetical protein
MFPLLNQEEENPAELFQIWLNLPKSSKFVEPHYRMLWSEDIPTIREEDEAGKVVRIRVVAGRLGDVRAPAPAPDSWAADAGNDVAIWIISLDAAARWRLPAAGADVRRKLYFFEGDTLEIDGADLPAYHAAELRSDQAIELFNGRAPARILLLQGRPIAEPVVQYGPFVMNTQAEIREAFLDFQETQFGGWPWDRPDPVYPRERGRFARYADGKEEHASKH